MTDSGITVEGLWNLTSYASGHLFRIVLDYLNPDDCHRLRTLTDFKLVPDIYLKSAEYITMRLPEHRYDIKEKGYRMPGNMNSDRIHIRPVMDEKEYLKDEVGEALINLCNLKKMGPDFAEMFPNLKEIKIAIEIHLTNGFPQYHLIEAPIHFAGECPLPASCKSMILDFGGCPDVKIDPAFIPRHIESLKFTGVVNCRFMKRFGKSIFPPNLKHLRIEVDRKSSVFVLNSKPDLESGFNLETLAILYYPHLRKLQIEHAPATHLLCRVITPDDGSQRPKHNTEISIGDMPEVLTNFTIEDDNCPKLSIKSSHLETIYLMKYASGLTNLVPKSHPKLQRLCVFMSYWVNHKICMFPGIVELHIDSCIEIPDPALYRKFRKLRLIGIRLHHMNTETGDPRTRLYLSR